MEGLLALLKEIKPNVDFEHCGGLVEEGLLDSLDIVAIIEALATKMGVVLDGNDISPEHFNSVSKLYELVQKKVQLRNVNG